MNQDLSESLLQHNSKDLLAFWTNVHNLLTLHASLLLGEPSRNTVRVTELSPLRRDFRYAIGNENLLFNVQDCYKLVSRSVRAKLKIPDFIFFLPHFFALLPFIDGLIH